MKGLVFLLASCSVLWGDEKVEILRDDYGVPHIFASTAAGAAFGSGYAQAQDRLEEMLRNYRKAEGTMSEVFGQDFVFHDYRQRLWRHRQVAEQHYKDLDPKLRAICEAFQAGVKKFMQEHPEQPPARAAPIRADPRALH
jgi:acyl-homoserine-lactone acylase